MVMSFEMTMDQAIQFFVLKGDAVLFAWILAEQAGLPIPTIPLLLAAGALANTGRIHLARSLVLALTACLMADGFWYQMGRCHGTKVLRPLCRIALAPDSWIHRIKAAFRRHGARAALRQVRTWSEFRCATLGRDLWSKPVTFSLVRRSGLCPLGGRLHDAGLYVKRAIPARSSL